MFTPVEIQSLLGVVDFHNSFLIISMLGKDVLDEWDRFILKQNGIDIDKIEEEFPPTYFQSLMWGRLSSLLQEKDAKDISYTDFEKYVKQGQYIPLSPREQREYEISRQKTYTHLKGLGTKLRNDVSTILTNEIDSVKQEYESIIQQEIERGVLERRTAKSIISEIGHRTEVWNHDWGRIVETECNNVFQLGRAQTIAAEKGEDATVFKDVFSGACRHCIKLFLTSGIGSQPRLFKLSELAANGDNIGLKVSDWKPVLSSVHPHCRCHLRYLPKGYEWNDEEGKFVPSEKKEDLPRIERRSKVKVTIGDKVRFV